ncbi:complex I subunit 4 family protein [Pontibacillus yanchengensis]|uniref:NADH:ubiquinone oxidoreductase subunit M n=1 Tax=Pontibacillus yanchengensis Y32 TaxID=1385514 RepID=A0A0A2TRB0_9BACI|nr:NADH-quinone oxidoreductase subunit M [Pontibacillus yanchengensis]KGP71795.1 NADH:ubiquinone oxidoreductase subunit M [Pontibacillus yanchengensis Y32]
MGWLTLLVFSPIVGIVLLLLVPSTQAKLQKRIAVICSILPLIMSIIVYQQFHSGADLSIRVPWISFGQYPFSFFVEYELGVSGFSLVLLLLTAVLMIVSMVTATMQIKKGWKQYALLTLLLEIGILGVFASQNLILFFIFFELTLVPMFLLIGKWGGMEKERAAYSYLLYNGIGSAILLIVIIVLFANVGSTNYEAIANASLSTELSMGLLISLLIAFGVKLPIVPLHTWMVRVHVQAPPALVMIHAGVLLKIGAYGLMQFGIGFFPASFQDIAPVVAILGLVNLLYGACIAFVQKELRSLFAYSSISHMGIVLLGIAAMNEAGLQGAMFQTISHGLIAALVFFLIGVVKEKTETTYITRLGGLSRTMPLTAGVLLAVGLASLGLPGMSGFVSEFMTFLGIFESMPVIAAIGTIGIILTAAYILRAVMDITFGKEVLAQQGIADLQGKEWIPVSIMLGLILLIGVFPTSLTHSIQTSVEAIVLRIGG